MSRIAFDDVDFDDQFGRTLYATLSDSADLGEAFATAGRVTDGDMASWYQESGRRPPGPSPPRRPLRQPADTG